MFHIVGRNYITSVRYSRLKRAYWNDGFLFSVPAQFTKIHMPLPQARVPTAGTATDIPTLVSSSVALMASLSAIVARFTASAYPLPNGNGISIAAATENSRPTARRYAPQGHGSRPGVEPFRSFQRPSIILA